MTEQPNVKPEAPKAKQDTSHRARVTAGFVSWETGIGDLVLTGDYQDVTADQANQLRSAAAAQGVAVVIDKKETEN